MSEVRQVIVTNMINGNVSIRKPHLGLNRQWQKFGQKMRIPFDILEEALWDSGVRNMFESGYLYIENLQDKKDLGLEPEDATEPVNIINLDPKKMEEMWKSLPLDVFKAQFGKLTKVQADSLIEYAITNKIVNTDKCSWVKEVTKKDILKAISTREDMAALDKAEAAKRK